jgi:hypothetical protein
MLQILRSGIMTYGSSVLALRIGCAERLGDGLAVLQMLQDNNEGAGDETWRLFHTVQALGESGDVAGAHDSAARLQSLAKSNFSVNSQDLIEGYYLAFSDRVLGQKDDAYEVLKRVFPGMIDYLPLLRADHSLEIFDQDSEFQELSKSFDAKNEETRKRIEEIERGYN